jgi:CheY-like chemotaxis protein
MGALIGLAPHLFGMNRVDPDEIQVDSAGQPNGRQDLRKDRARTHSEVPGFRILVVDDEQSVREYFRRVLVGAGYQVWLAKDGEDALARMGERRFHVVLMDLVMPDREGLETIEIVRKDYPHAKIVAVSGAFGGQFLKVAQALGADAILMKPVSPDQLLETVHEMVEASR